MYFGVDYHPEQWVFPYGGTAENPEAAWQHDVDLMVKAGINVVRIGEFTWGLCEPEDGKFDFDWLKRVMDILGEAGIQVVLATPTAAPPIWLTKKHPEILPARRTRPRQTRRHAPRRLPQQRGVLEPFQAHRRGHGQGARPASAAHRLAD